MSSPTAHGPILVVDDDPDIREALREILDDAGYRVAVAHHGKRALELLGEIDRPCMVLLDRMMPEMDGEQFIQRFRQQAAYSTVPVILCTASGSTMIPGVQGLLKKPFELDELLSILRGHCG